MALARGAPGLPGTKGEPGERGYRGEKGAKGDAGSSGRLPRKPFYRGGRIGGKKRRINSEKNDRVRPLIPHGVSSHEDPSAAPLRPRIPMREIRKLREFV